MSRINLGNGRWFDPEKSLHWEEDTRWDGRNHISVPTGSQWEHEELYKTASGTWIMHAWSQWQGSTPSYNVVTEAEAVQWLIDNDHDVSGIAPETMAAAEL